MKARTRKLAVLAASVATVVGSLGIVAPPAHADTNSPPTDNALGARPPTDVVLAAMPKSGAEATAPPATADLTRWAQVPGNQGQVGSCVAWAIDYGMLGWYSNHDGRPGTPFAPMFTYAQINGGVDQGSFPVDALTVAQDQGSDTWSNYTQGGYDWWSQPTAAEKANASHYKISGYHRLFAGTGQSGSVNAIKAALASGHPVAIEVAVRPGFDALGANHSTSALDTDTTGTIRGWHEVLALGYNASGLLFENSWGNSWGFSTDVAGGMSAGFSRLSWSVVQHDVVEADTIDGFAPGNWAPDASDGAMGLRSGLSLTRSVASLATDHDGDHLTYELTQQGFASKAFNFTWNASTGTFGIKVPAGNSGSSYLKFRVKDPTGGVSRYATLKLDFVA